MENQKTALEEFGEIGFWNMECVRISLRNYITEITEQKEELK